MRSLLVCGILAVALLAGCSGKDKAPDMTDETMPPTAWTFPVVHHADGRLASAADFGDLPVMEERMVGDRGSGEPTIGVNAQGVAIYPSIAFDAIPDNPTNALSGNLPKTNVYISTDDGKSWEDRSPAVNLARTDPVSMDPFVYADPVTGRLFNMDLYVGCSNLQYTDDAGLTWITNPFSCGVPVDDHQSLVSGPVVPPVPANPLYPRTLYYCVNQLAASTCSHSFDGGLTWIAGASAFGANTPGEADQSSCAGLTGHAATSEKTGTVFLPAGCSNGRNDPGHAELARSTDNGVTWSHVIVDESVGFDGHDGSIGVDKEGTVYYFFLDGNTLPRLSVSTDDGASWSKPLNVTAPGVTTAKFPAIAAGEGGRIAFLYVGSTTPSGRSYSNRTTSGDYEREDELHNATWNGYVGFSFDATAADPTFATVQVNAADDPLARGDCDGRCYKLPNQGMFDFLDLQTRPDTGQVWVSLVDMCTKECVHGTDQDTPDSRGAVGVQVGGPLLGSRLP